MISSGVTLKSMIAKPIAIANAKMIAPRESSVSTSCLALLLGRVVRRDRERPEPDRERLAERDDAADDGQAEEPVPRHHRVDRTVDLGDLAVRLAHRERPVRRPAHHHAFEDGLAADGSVTHRER